MNTHNIPDTNEQEIIFHYISTPIMSVCTYSVKYQKKTNINKKDIYRFHDSENSWKGGEGKKAVEA